MWMVPAMWSSNYIIARCADGVIAPQLLASGRWLLAGLLPLTLLVAWLAPSPPLGAKAAALVVLAPVLPGVLSYSAYS